jgi:hypothetical protein
MRFPALPVLACTGLLLSCATKATQAQAPIQEWINQAAQSGGGVVTIPPGVHELPSGLLLHGVKKLALRGMERERCVLRLADTVRSEALITIGAQIETVEIANLVLETAADPSRRRSELPLAIRCGPGDAMTTAGQSNGPRGVTIRDCIFQNWPSTAIHLSDTHDAAVERCSFREIGGIAVRMDRQSQAVHVLGCWFIRCGLALEIVDSASGRFIGNEILQGQDGIRIRGTATVKAADQPSGHELSHNHLAQLNNLALHISATAAPARLSNNDIDGKTEVQGTHEWKQTKAETAVDQAKSN